MNQLKATAQKMHELIEFAESQSWSEEELAKVIDILHSELGNRAYLPDLSTCETKL